MIFCLSGPLSSQVKVQLQTTKWSANIPSGVLQASSTKSWTASSANQPSIYCQHAWLKHPPYSRHIGARKWRLTEQPNQPTWDGGWGVNITWRDFKIKSSIHTRTYRPNLIANKREIIMITFIENLSYIKRRISGPKSLNGDFSKIYLKSFADKLQTYEQYGRNHVSWYAVGEWLQTCRGSLKAISHRKYFKYFKWIKVRLAGFITVGQQCAGRIIINGWRRLFDQNVGQYKKREIDQSGKKKLGSIQDEKRGSWMSALAWMIKYHSWAVTFTTWNWNVRGKFPRKTMMKFPQE